ncbi:MAG: 2-oxo acid dehydrogenase subunit E2 [Clostridiales bacterium]|nr:2-oxo acid dehydrogenase subunit E2 [Candidatus Cacconaster stercorequi]
MRPDGTRVKDLPPLVAAVPYIMPKRYDAQNTITENIDSDLIKAYIREKRRLGVRLNHMAVIISAYYKAVLENPKLNYFVMNSKIYKRNHFAVSFVIMKKLADGRPSETTLKIYLEPDDTVFRVSEKIQAAIDANAATEQSNSTDRFARRMFSIPGLPKFVVWVAYHLDKHGLLPRKIIDLSPFHTSMFITNLASIKTSYIHHHCYEFGTTSVFVCMGKPVPNYMNGEYKSKIMPLGIVMDERICTGYEYAAFCNDFRKYLRQPEMLEPCFGAE